MPHSPGAYSESREDPGGDNVANINMVSSRCGISEVLNMNALHFFVKYVHKTDSEK